MQKIIYSLVLLFALSMTIHAQSDISGGLINGKLVDAITEKPVPFGNIRVLQQKDSLFVTGQPSEEDGTFSLIVNNGSYIVHISFMGYNDVYKNIVVTTKAPVVDMGTISLTHNTILLNETVVTAKAAEVVVKGDTLEYNADSYKVTESAVVEDLIKKMPGAEIDENGKITINGKEIKKILVDGEEFFSNDPKVASKNLPARMVNKVQVFDKSTDISRMTGFDDGEEESVINLSVRPGMKEGLFGNAFAGYGSKDRYEANIMANYMKNKDQYTLLGGLNNTNNAGFSDIASATFGGMGGRRGRGMSGGSGITESGNGGINFSKQFSSKLKLGGNVRYGQTNTDVTSKVHTQNLLSSGNTLEDENNASNNFSRNFNVDLRMEWTPDTLTRIIFEPQIGYSDNNQTERGSFLTTKELTGDTINNGNSDYYSEGNSNSMGARLDFSRQLGKPGRVFSFQLSGNTNDAENNGTNISNTYYTGTRPDDIIDQHFTNTNTNNSYRGYVSYVEPVGFNNFIQLAYNYNQNNSKSDKDTRSKDLSGDYTVLDSLYSKRLENTFVNQEMEVNFRADRGVYDYTIGFSAQPSSSRSKTFIGDHMINDLSQNVWNFSPMAQFNYRWSRQKNLRIRYFGDTDQPSVQQLSPVVDVSDPLNVRYGNPNLKPSFQHRFNVRYMNFDQQKGSAYNFFANAGYMTNDIVSTTFTDIKTGRKETTYENVKGNWNANGRLMMNIPLKSNIKFSISSMTFAGYNHINGFSNNEPNLSKTLNLGQGLGVNYRSDIFDFGVRGNVNYNGVKNSLEGQRDQEYYNYNTTANTTIYFPYDFTLESDISYSTNSGYSDGYKQNEWLWNASLQKALFKDKSGTLRFKIYDILQQRSNISRNVTSNFIRDTTSNTLTSYFMFHFIYRFNFFKGGATASDMMPGGPGRPGEGGRPEGPGGRGGGDRYH
mgnify:FL=1